MAKQVKSVVSVVAPVVTVATVLDNDTRIAPNPLGVGRVQPGKCVAQALASIGAGCTVAEYRERMAAWVAKHPAPHMAYPGGSNADRLLRYLVDSNRKVVVDTKATKATARVAKAATKAATKAVKAAVAKVRKPKATKATTVAASEPQAS